MAITSLINKKILHAKLLLEFYDDKSDTNFHTYPILCTFDMPKLRQMRHIDYKAL